MAAIHQIIVKLLDGDSRCIRLPSSSISGADLKRHVHTLSGVPIQIQLLIAGSRLVHDETLIHSRDGAFPSCSLLLRLRGGKGGFGSLLRGAATKAGQKKTNNFDACRDMSGRRLRHVNAERKLEEWKAEAEARRLEKVAEEFLRKKTKEAKRSNSKEVASYVQKYKEVSEKCADEVEEAVRQSFALYEEGKRKALPISGKASKRLKIWFGKNKAEESHSEDESDDEDEILLAVGEGNNNNEAGSSGTTSGGPSDGEVSGGSSDECNLEVENVIFPNMMLEEGTGSGTGDSSMDFDDLAATNVRINGESSPSVGDLGVLCEDDKETLTCDEIAKTAVLLQDQVGQSMSLSSCENLAISGEIDISDASLALPNVVVGLSEDEVSNCAHDVVAQSESIAYPENDCMSIPVVDPHRHSPSTNNCVQQLDFDRFNSAAELEILGMEKLKVALQVNGLKCGGTLQERAVRLFLLKTTPIDKLPKKVLARASPPGSK